MLTTKYFSVLFIQLMILNNISSALRVLVIPAHNIASHTKAMHQFTERLAVDNHKVHVLQVLSDEKEKAKAKGKNVNDIYITYPKDYGLDLSILWKKTSLKFFGFIFPWYISSNLCHEILNNSKLVDEYLKVVKQHWDLIIVDNLCSPCGILATQLNPTVPFIEYSTTIIMIDTMNIKGPQFITSYMPFFNPPGRFKASDFFDRFWNAFDIYGTLLAFNDINYYLPIWVNNTIAKDIDRKKFVSGSRLAIGSGMPYELDFVHPKSTSVIEMDAACPTASELQEPFLSFIEHPKSKGTILFTVGHIVNFEDAPNHVLNVFVDVFNELSDYRIIWQYMSKREKPKVGDHVMLEKWLPQGDILHHNKTVLFFTHMGVKSFRESVCEKVPTVGLPIFAEDSRTAAVAWKHGFGENVDKTELNKDDLLQVLKKVLEDPKYKINISRMQRMLDDRIMDPLKLGSFWVNFAVTHKRADEFFRQKVPTLFCEYSSYFLFIVISMLFISVLQ